jgi:hypothetical protein
LITQLSDFCFSGIFHRQGSTVGRFVDTGLPKREPIQIPNQFHQQKVFEYLPNDTFWENNLHLKFAL